MDILPILNQLFAVSFSPLTALVLFQERLKADVVPTPSPLLLMQFHCASYRSSTRDEPPVMLTLTSNAPVNGISLLVALED